MLKEAEKYLKLLDGQYYKCFGKVVKVVGLTIESVGPEARLNDLCKIYLEETQTQYVIAEVVGFHDSHLILMPFEDVEGVGMKSSHGTAGKLFTALADANVNVKMIDQGSSELNIIVGV